MIENWLNKLCHTNKTYRIIGEKMTNSKQKLS